MTFSIKSKAGDIKGVKHIFVSCMAGLILSTLPAACQQPDGITSPALPSFVVPPRAAAPAPLATPGGAGASAATSDQIPILDPVKFFTEFFSERNPSPKDQFETDEEYRKRIQPKLNLSQTYYFIVPPRQYGDQFKYDIKSGALAILAGDGLSTLAHDKAAKGTVPICLLSNIVNDGSYNAVNGFGASVSVNSFDMTEYVLDIANSKAASDYLDFHNNRLVVGKTITDRDEAKRLSTDGEIVVGVQLMGFKASNSVQEYITPTFDQPTKSNSQVYFIDVNIKNIILVDKAKNLPIGAIAVK